MLHPLRRTVAGHQQNEEMSIVPEPDLARYDAGRDHPAFGRGAARPLHLVDLCLPDAEALPAVGPGLLPDRQALVPDGVEDLVQPQGRADASRLQALPPRGALNCQGGSFRTQTPRGMYRRRLRAGLSPQLAAFRNWGLW